MSDKKVAADMIKKLSADRDAWKRRAEAAERDMFSVIKLTDDACQLCAHYQACKEEACPRFTSGMGVTDLDGTQYPNMKWTCMDFKYGTCKMLEDTPCNGCNFENHWTWRGPRAENGGVDI